MADFKLSDALYRGSKEKILLSGTAEKTTNTAGPSGIGLSASRPTALRTPAKYSGAAKVLDYIIVKGEVNALATQNDSVYGEMSHSGKTYRFVANQKRVSYEKDAPHGFYKLVPVILYYLSNDLSYPELANTFRKIVTSYNTTGFANMNDLLLFCDSFYYGIAKDYTDLYKVGENELAIETIKQAYDSGYLSPLTILDDCKLPDFTAFTVKETKSKRKETKNNKNIFNDVKSGKYIIPYSWSEKQQLKIPPLSSLDDYIPNKQFWSILNKISYRLNKVMLRLDSGEENIAAIAKDYINLFLLGKPGTGKTKTLYALAAALGLPIYTVAMTKNTEEDTFEGMTKIVEGNLNFVETDALDAIANGGILVLEEINLADPAVIMGAIGQTIEFPFVLMKNGYEPIRRHPLLIVCGTMNIGTYGSKSINQALSSRFKQAYILNDTSENDFINILKKQLTSTANSVDESAFEGTSYTPRELDDKYIKWVYRAYDRIISYLKSPSVNAEDIALSVTMRGCIGALENIEEGEDPKEAIRNTLIGKIAESDLELAEAVNAEIESLPDII